MNDRFGWILECKEEEEEEERLAIYIHIYVCVQNSSEGSMHGRLADHEISYILYSR